MFKQKLCNASPIAMLRAPVFAIVKKESSLTPNRQDLIYRLTATSPSILSRFGPPQIGFVSISQPKIRTLSTTTDSFVFARPRQVHFVDTMTDSLAQVDSIPQSSGDSVALQ